MVIVNILKFVLLNIKNAKILKFSFKQIIYSIFADIT